MTESSSTSSSTDRTITLVSNDGKGFTVPRDVIRRSGTIEDMIGVLNFDATEGPIEPIPLPEVKGDILEMVVKYCKKHLDDPIIAVGEENDTSTISEWDQSFLNVDQTTLYHLILAANYLNIENLLDVCCQTVANMVRGKSVEDMRRIYNITNDYTEEEENEIKKENAWCEI